MTRKKALPDWSELVASLEQSGLSERAYAIRKEIARRTMRRKRHQRVAGAAALAALISVAGYLVSNRAPRAPVAVSTAGEDTVALAPRRDRKPTVKALRPETRFISEETDQKRTYHIHEGALQFETHIENKKQLVVRVGDLVIEDIGTVFTVEVLADNQARILVTEGRVNVRWPGGFETLGSAEEGVFPPTSGEGREAAKGPRSAPQKPRPPLDDWRSLARMGKYRQAFEILNANPERLSNKVDDLLLAADVMRFSGRPIDAVRYLETVTALHKGDPRSSLASFTLGRVFLDELGRPLEAARAFVEARKTEGPLAEKALAREVEAWSRAGETDRAKRAAGEYLRRYPNGDRVDVVRAFGGLNGP